MFYQFFDLDVINEQAFKELTRLILSLTKSTKQLFKKYSRKYFLVESETQFHSYIQRICPSYKKRTFLLKL